MTDFSPSGIWLPQHNGRKVINTGAQEGGVAGVGLGGLDVRSASASKCMRRVCSSWQE